MVEITTPKPMVDNGNQSAFLLTISGQPQSVTSSFIVRVAESIPESFLAGWADYKAGRVVDMDRVLGDEPPPA
jgi:hypothetical protein